MLCRNCEIFVCLNIQLGYMSKCVVNFFDFNKNFIHCTCSSELKMIIYGKYIKMEPAEHFIRALVDFTC